MKRVPALSTSLLLMVCATAAVADGNSILQGNYGLTGTAICNLGSGAVTTSILNGTLTFHSDGTGAVSLISHGMTAGAIGSAVDAENVDTFTYSVNGDGSWTRVFDPGSLRVTVLSGPNAGLTCSTDQLPTMTGSVGVFAQTLTSATNQAVVETTTCSNGTVTRRICQRWAVLIKRPGE